CLLFFFFQAEDGIRDFHVTGVQTCALPISTQPCPPGPARPPSLARRQGRGDRGFRVRRPAALRPQAPMGPRRPRPRRSVPSWRRSEEHTSELQSRENLVCRLLLEKNNNNNS